MTAPVPFSAEELLAESSWLRRLAGTLVAGDAAAEDLVQETWLVALRHPPEVGGSPRPWLARIARNLASNFRRAEARRKGHEAEASPREPELDPAALTAAVDAQRVLAEAVLALDEELRSVVVLRYLRGQDSRAIGRQLGIPDGTVRWRLKRALELLRAELDRRHGGERQVWCAAFAFLLPRAPAVPLAPTGAGLTEVLVMSTSTKIALSAAAVLAGLFATWVFTRHEDAVAAVAASDGAPVVAAEAPSPTAVANDERVPARTEREVVLPAGSAVVEPEPAACCVVGRVLDPGGRGVAGAIVLARAPRLGGLRAQLANDEEASLATTSGAGGVFSLALPDARPFVLSASHADFAPSPCASVFAGERHDLALSAGSRLVVSVRTSAHAPCAGADVSVRIAAPDSSGELWSGAGKTGADGTIAFAGLPAGNAGVEARSGAELGLRRVETDGRSEARCEVPLDATGRITGTVRDRETGRPIAGARVGNRAADVVDATTDARGRYELSGIGLGIGLWSLGARARGYSTYFEFLNVPPEAPERTLDIALDPAARVAGRVVDRAQRAVPGARLVFLATVPFEPFTAETDRVEAVTDAAGRFELELRPGVVHRVLVRAPDHGTGVFALGPFTVGVRAEVEELVLEAEGALSGTVPHEYVARACSVRLSWAGEEPTELETLLETTRADPRGRFAFDGLAPGRYRLALVDSDAKSRRASTSALAEVRVDLAPGEERRGVTFHPGEGTVAGTVFGPSGRGAPACRVSLWSLAAPERELAAAMTDSSGRFRLQVEDPGPFRLTVDDRQLLLERRTLAPVEVGSVDLAIDLVEYHSPFAIRGRLVPETGALPGDVFVGFRDASGERLQRVGIPESDGAFTMRNLRDEIYTVELVDIRSRYEPVRIDGVRPGGEEVVLRLRARE